MNSPLTELVAISEVSIAPVSSLSDVIELVLKSIASIELSLFGLLVWFRLPNY